MKYPNTTYAGQKDSICNRYIELFRLEHNTHPLRAIAKSLRDELDALTLGILSDHRLAWLRIKWKDVLNGNDKLGFPGFPPSLHVLITAKKDEAYQAWRSFAKWQREEHDVTVKMLLRERRKAMEECRQDNAHNPTLSDFVIANGKVMLNVPAQNPHNESTNIAFAPTSNTAWAAAIHVRLGTITSSL